MNAGQLDKVKRRVNRRMDREIPYDLWDRAEQAYYDYFVVGQACPSSGAIQSVQVTEKRKRKDVPKGTGRS